ncbi:hypothetical protein ASE63_02600 [Bosea sp. Root381]|uniref:DUF3306 domain-containing protein n=1 Tax=Bosea sp. Root381 TaxID=1736524 RepID=UPI0006FE6DBE|nr:DUF3306 domain-containing protein [Bosea sp. Root381]KRE18092.1 hypothetical protein ASE63_02600 [Bosea sp. Root381]
MSAGAPEDEGFLGRWSRRKRELTEPEATRAPAAVEIPVPAEAGLPATEPAQAEPEPEIEPPSLDLIDKDFELAPWLKRNVPESWKLAALRRAWESDPAIRDYVNPARDYALEWNTPGGAPGYGPLTESDDVDAMLRAIFGEAPEPEKPAEEAADAAGDAMPHQLSSNDETADFDAAVRDQPVAPAELASVRLSATGDNRGDAGDVPAKTPPPSHVAVQDVPPEKDTSLRIRRRGGGAVPI